MIGMVAAASSTRYSGKNRIRVLPVGSYRFSFIHPTLGIVTIRNATNSDIPALRKTLCKTSADLTLRLTGEAAVCPSEQESADLLGCNAIVLVTCNNEDNEVIIATITLFKADVFPDLKRAIERFADNGSDSIRISRFAALDKVTGFNRRPMIVAKEVLAKMLNDARRRRGVILVMRNVVVDAAFRKTDILKFISRKLTRILKYMYRCSHIIGEDFPSGMAVENNDSGNGSDYQELFKRIELGRREPDPQEDATADINCMVRPDLLWISSCETTFDIPPKKGVLRVLPHISAGGLRRSARYIKTAVRL